VAEEDGGGRGGGGLGGTVTLPGLGPVKKKIVIGVGGAAAAFVLWRYWQARQAGEEVVAGDSDGDGFADGGILPSVSGAVRPDNDYGQSDGSGTGSGGSTDSYGFTGTTNSQWTQYASTQLSAASDKWSYGDVLEALGQYLGNKPLTTAQQQIVQAAIAAAGNPPEGTHPIIPGGNVPITVAPAGLKVTATTTTTVTLAWSPVSGAGYYRVYRSGSSTNVGATDGANTTITIGGLRPNTEYSFQVAADTTSGTPGPKSASVKGRTKTVTLAKPSGVRVSSVSKTTAKVSWSKVSGADYYRIYINGANRGSADGGLTSYTVTGLKANTSYKVSVAADTTNQTPGPQSGAVSFRTKK
jgi:hypothetical protein